MRAPLLAVCCLCLGAGAGARLGAAEAGAPAAPAPAAAPTPEAAAAAAPQVYAVGSPGITLSAPPDWSATRDLDGAQLVLRAPPPPAVAAGGERERARAAVSVVVQELRAPETPEAFARRCRADLERLGTAVEVESQEPVTLAGRIWTRVAYRFQVGRFSWQQELYATTIDGAGYCVTCSCSAREFARWQAAFAAVLGSLAHSRPALEGR